MRGEKLEVRAGDRYGRLVVIGELDPVFTPNGTRNRVVECRCECGRVGEFRLPALRSGKTRSCGCFSREVAVERGRRQSARNVKHGKSGTAEYGIWVGMLNRCENPENPGYGNYGGRGIRVCQRWRESFLAFLEDMGPRPAAGLSIDRVDNDGDYEPGNCRWATSREQARNTRSNVLVEHDGETLCVAEWAERYGICPSLLHSRLKAGWCFEAAVSTGIRSGDAGFYATRIRNRDRAWYAEYARREAQSRC